MFCSGVSAANNHILTDIVILALYRLCAEMLHHLKVKDYAQRFSVGTLYYEGRDRILLGSTAMAGGYINTTTTSSSCASSSSSSNGSYSSYSHMPSSAPTAARDLLASASSSPTISGKGKGKKALDSEDTGPSWEEAVAAAAAAGGGREREITQAESIELFAAESMDGEIEPILSSSSVRLKCTQERERADREFRGRWSGILDLAAGMLSHSLSRSKGQGQGQGLAGRAEGVTDSGVCTYSSSALGNGTGPSAVLGPDTNGQGQGQSGAVKGRVKKVKDSGASGLSAASTVSAAQALLDETCNMQPYVNQPGEVFAETMRSTLGELMMVSCSLASVFSAALYH